MFNRMVGKKIVLMHEVMRSGKQQDKTVSLDLKLTDSDGRPSEVMKTPCLLGNKRWRKTQKKTQEHAESADLRQGD